MKEQVYLAVDLGAESGRLMAGLWNGKRIRLEEIHRFPNGPIEIAGTLRWDVLHLWTEVQNSLARAASKYGKHIKSVGVDTWGVDYVLLSRSDEMVSQPFHYRDARTRGMMQRAFARVPRGEIFAATGLQFMELNTLYQLLALQLQSPEVLAAADQLLMIPDFFHWCLSGNKAVEFTNATTTQFYHATNRNWAADLLKRFGLPVSILPKVIEPGTSLGRLRPEIAKQWGLGDVAVIAPATHDTGAAVVSVPAGGKKQGAWCYLSSGTWSLIGLELSHPQLSPKVLEFNLTNEGGVDGTYRLLKNISGLWLVQQCKRAFERKGRRLDYVQLVNLARTAPPLRSLFDPDDSRFVNPHDMVAAIQNFCRETHQPIPKTEGALVRCVLESLALKYELVLGKLEQVGGRHVEIIHVVGGGSQNGLLNQFTSDACERPVAAGPVEATALGNVLIQARACGEVGSLDELRSVVAKSSAMKTFEPRKQSIAAWKDARDRFAGQLKS